MENAKKDIGIHRELAENAIKNEFDKDNEGVLLMMDFFELMFKNKMLIK